MTLLVFFDLACRVSLHSAMQDSTQVTKAGIIPALQPQSSIHGMNSTMEIMDVLYVNSSTGHSLTRTDSNTITLDDASPPSDIAMMVLISTAICFACVVIIGCYWNPRKRRKDPDVPELAVHHSQHSHHFSSPPIMIDESHIKMEELKLRVYRHSMYFVYFSSCIYILYFHRIFPSYISIVHLLDVISCHFICRFNGVIPIYPLSLLVVSE